MDSGLSWADQWDTNPDLGTEASGNSKKKKDSGKSKFNKSLLSFKWIKELKNKVEIRISYAAACRKIRACRATRRLITINSNLHQKPETFSPSAVTTQ
ncbi:hypothetical protein V6N11_011632 [Hibiscus sabdariffa]|uniref:Uncharacterized protein n=1 Tax=Hibiscus sabdariffa TaxID=183260 RepID=A0ABR2S9D3_9ROSI